MAQGYQALTEKEKQTLRLIVRGHDAKSMARHLGLSVHTVNERLRDARRKLSVSSSREAARLVFDAEGFDPEKLVDTRMGEAATPESGHIGSSQPGPRTQNRFLLGVAGVAIMSVALGILALAALTTGGATTFGDVSPSASASVAASESEAVSAARAWLELGDQARWEDGWRATGAAFRQANTATRWAEVSSQVRVPLGAVRSRVLLSQENVPAPPAGVELVKFRTNFTNKPGAIETLTLAREDGAWKVVGIYLD